ncbi:MAG: hypothetical protein KGQ42_06715 [Alphaproteobacteria bacterium]|nr:hypothetical protein [Alphaproteobacteria bacterium]MDE2042566.1 hypothetical protein [Alphaproteobacteria bacterium]MDE2340579.1 hypothetical protein [Alphaproteobacteria bacterium]
MRNRLILAGVMSVGAVALSASFVMAHSSYDVRKLVKKRMEAHELRSDLGTFTPASADPRLAAALSHTGVMSAGFRFTPSSNAYTIGHSVTVAVRARDTGAHEAGPAHATLMAQAGHNTASVSSLPVAYNLGVAVGWKKFALTSDYRKTDLGLIQGGREGAGMALSYTGRKWSSRVSISTEHALSTSPKALGLTSDVALDVGGAYRLTHNLDLTAGVRYKREREQLFDVIDNKRDSQAVYIGTQFKF